MHETALSIQDAEEAGVRFRVVACGAVLRIDVGDREDDCYDMEQVLRLVWLALEHGREVRIARTKRMDRAKELP